MKKFFPILALCLGITLTDCTTYVCCDQSVIIVDEALIFEWNATRTPQPLNLSCPMPWRLEGTLPGWLGANQTTGNGDATLIVELRDNNTGTTPITYILSFLASNGDKATCKVTVLGKPADTYIIEMTTPAIAKGGTHTFAGATEGFYSSLSATTFTVTSTGTGAMTNFDVTITGTDFTLDKTGLNTTLAPSGTTSFTIKPKDGLTAGTHTAVVSITDPNMGSDFTFTVRFVVGTIYGSYSGKVTVNSTLLSLTDYEVSPITVKLAPETTDHSLEIASLIVSGTTIPSYKIIDVAITPASDYSLSAPVFDATIPEIEFEVLGLPVTLYDVPVRLTLTSGSITGSNITLEIKIEVDLGLGYMDFGTITFAGTLP